MGTALQNLYTAQKTLAKAFPEWEFSLDGKLIGDIGEAIAGRVFGLKRLTEGEKDARHDNSELEVSPSEGDAKGTRWERSWARTQ
jgi:hypothetical protein